MFNMNKLKDKGSTEVTTARTNKKIPDALELAGLDWSPIPARQLTVKQRNFLKAKAHELKSSVRIGQEGVTGAVVGEIRKQLLLHELIKVKWSGLSREEGKKKDQAEALAEKIGAHYIHLVGHNLILYREVEPEYVSPPRAKKIELPA
jgi:RNA-binding protein